MIQNNKMIHIAFYASQKLQKKLFAENKNANELQFVCLPATDYLLERAYIDYEGNASINFTGTISDSKNMKIYSDNGISTSSYPKGFYKISKKSGGWFEHNVNINIAIKEEVTYFREFDEIVSEQLLKKLYTVTEKDLANKQREFDEDFEIDKEKYLAKKMNNRIESLERDYKKALLDKDMLTAKCIELEKVNKKLNKKLKKQIL